MVDIYDFKPKESQVEDIPEVEISPEDQMIVDIIDSFLFNVIGGNDTIEIYNLVQNATHLFYMGYQFGFRDSKMEMIQQLQCDLCEMDDEDCNCGDDE